VEDLCYTSLQTKAASSLSATLNTVCRQPALGRSRPGHCPVVAGAWCGSAGPLQWVCRHPPARSHPSQPLPWRDGDQGQPTRQLPLGATATQRRRRRKRKRKEFRKHRSLGVLFPGMRTSVCKSLGKRVSTATISVEVHKRKATATGSCWGWFISASGVTGRDWKVITQSKPFSLHHVNLEEQRIPHSWGNSQGQGGEISYVTALQRGNNTCCNNNLIYKYLSETCSFQFRPKERLRCLKACLRFPVTLVDLIIYIYIILKNCPSLSLDHGNYSTTEYNIETWQNIFSAP